MVGIIGAGISGLSTAYFLQKQAVPYVVLESAAKAGGYLQSQQKGAYTLDIGANSLLCDQALLDFLVAIGVGDKITESNAVSKNRFILKNGSYKALPTSPLALLWSNYFSWQAKKSIWRELSNKSKSIDNETISQFFERRFCKEIVDYAVNPFVMGIYAGNPAELLIKETFPTLVQYEKEYGSIIKGFIKNKVGGRKKVISLKGGMQQIPLTLSQQTNVQYDTQVIDIEKDSNQEWRVKTNKGDFLFSKLVITSPTFQTANFIENYAPDFAAALRQVYYPPMAAVHIAYKKANFSHPLNGFGGLHPTQEGKFTAGVIWSSAVFTDKCPADEVLLTVFVGGTLGAEKFQLTDEEILNKVHTELSSLYGIAGQPVFEQVSRWQQAIPQYDQKVLPLHAFIQKLETEGIYIAANWYKGVSLPDCIAKAKAIATHLAS
jgi:oxygen-dependent protoporphyrinogen oxidase